MSILRACFLAVSFARSFRADKTTCIITRHTIHVDDRQELMSACASVSILLLIDPTKTLSLLLEQLKVVLNDTYLAKNGNWDSPI